MCSYPSHRPRNAKALQAGVDCHPHAMANLVFSICAAVASALVSALAAVKGAPAVSAAFAALAIGFALRASESRWRR